MTSGEQGPVWDRVEYHVLSELKRLNDTVEQMERDRKSDHTAVVTEIGNVKTEIGALKVKASMYGALSGLASGVMVILTYFVGGGAHFPGNHG